MFTQTPDSLLIGFMGKRPLWYRGAGGVLLTAGARGGKLTTVLAYNICVGIYTPSMLILDMKGELAAISQDQTPDRKHCFYWNPANLHGLPQHKINPLDYIKIESPSLISDVKVLTYNLIPPSGRTNGDYFGGRAREFLEAIILTLVRMKGTLTFADLYAAVNLIPGGGEAWLDFAFEMNQSGFELSRRIEEEIAQSADDSSGGYRGILGEVFKALSPLSDPVLLASVSGPFDCSMEDLCADQAVQMYLMPPAEFIEPWAPVIKSFFVAGMIYKARKPNAPRQTWVLDECAQLGAFPLVEKLFTYGAGIGIRPIAVFQSALQMERLGKNSANIITSSAQLRMYFAIRDIETGSAVSRMLGAQTLEFDDELTQARARHAKHQAMQSIMNGGDPFMAGMSISHHKKEAQHRQKQHRLLRTPDEVLNTPKDKLYIFTDDLPGPLLAERKVYYEQAFMTGRYHPNPYHPPVDSVRVKTRWGHAVRPVVQEPVAHAFNGYPQYAGGFWSRIG
jgi:type IV secretion system protein VirD4